MPDRAKQLVPLAGAQARPQAFQQVEARTSRWNQGGGEAAAHRQPAEPDRKHQLHHHGGPKRGQGIGANAIEPAGQVESALGSGYPRKAHRQSHDRGQHQGDDAQFQAGGQALANHGCHRFLVGEGLA